jgi:hypothetical protein
MLPRRLYPVLIFMLTCQCTSTPTDRSVSPASPSIGTSYYVSPSGDDSDSGISPEEAWETIERVNALTCNPGDRILFEGQESFSGSLAFDSSDHGTPQNPITIGSYANGRATIQSGTHTGLYAYNTAAIEVMDLAFVGSGREDPDGADGISFYMDAEDGIRLTHIRIDNVDVSGYRGSGIEISADHPSGSGFKDVRITNSVIHDNGDKGIASSGYWPPNPANRSHKDIYIGYCKVHDNPGIETKDSHTGNGIVLSGVDGGTIEYCEAYNNGALNSGTEGGPFGIWAWEASNVIIQFCESHHNRTNNGKDGGGFDLDGGCVDCILQYNYSHDNHGAGYGLFQFFGASAYMDNIVRYNISENDGLIGYGSISFWAAIFWSGILNTQVYNNTLYVSSNTGGAGIEGSPASAGFVHNTKIYNNIIVTEPNKKAVRIPRALGVWRFLGNCYWTYGGPVEIEWNGNSYAGLAEWRSATRQERVGFNDVGLEVDPKLTDPGNGGTVGDPTQLSTLSAYRLQSDSPLIDAGLDLPSLFEIDPGLNDFYGARLPQFLGYDVGAHESDQNPTTRDRID